MAFESSGFILLVYKHGFKFEYLAFKLPKGQFCVMIIFDDHTKNCDEFIGLSDWIGFVSRPDPSRYLDPESVPAVTSLPRVPYHTDYGKNR